MKEVDQAMQALEPLGFERIETIDGASFRDCSTVVISPTRGQIDSRVVSAWQNLIAPMNQRRAFLFARGHEVGRAYNELLGHILQHEAFKSFKYVLTLEDDNLPPPDAHVRLLESIELGPFDAVSGLYFTKGDINMPQAYGDPNRYSSTGVLEFRPRDVADCIRAGRVMEVNGIAMGCGLWRVEMFREIPPPWFVTVADVVPGKGSMGFTQDLYFCERAKRVGKRFAVDCRVRVGHLDVQTGTVY
jgi:hypothetical protein